MQTLKHLDLIPIITNLPDDGFDEIGQLDEKYISEHVSLPRHNEFLFARGTTGFVKDTVKALETVGGIRVFTHRYEDFLVYQSRGIVVQ